ncbi:MAG: oxidoreductase, partial [Gammaproteobacteria bacterium HGW-Gammaproteobacteria-12]
MNNLIRLVEGQACIVSDDPWQLHEAEADAPLILPLAAWRERQPAEVLQGRAVSADGLLLQVDDEPEALQPFLASLPLIAIDFPSFRDGRGYSQAYLLRTRMGWRG